MPRLAEMIVSKFSTRIDDVCVIINQYLYWDINSLAFARHLALKRESILEPLRSSISRRSGFFHEEIDTTDEHWIFSCEEKCQLQAINCSVCGNYIYSNSIDNWLGPEKDGESFHQKAEHSRHKIIMCWCHLAE